VQDNLRDLKAMVLWNIPRGLQVLRIGSGMVPFATHPQYNNMVDYAVHFKREWEDIGGLVKLNRMRLTFHPDQFVLLNTPKQDVLERSILELKYQCGLLDLMGLDSTHKVQIHVGGVYGDKEAAKRTFVEQYLKLPDVVKKRLVIENCDRLFSLRDCVDIHRAGTKIPILFDNFHHECLNNGESLVDAVALAATTWHPERDGIPLMDYSSQEPGARVGNHAQGINQNHFRQYANSLLRAAGIKADIILEIKDKETSAMTALSLLKELAPTASSQAAALGTASEVILSTAAVLKSTTLSESTTAPLPVASGSEKRQKPSKRTSGASTAGVPEKADSAAEVVHAVKSIKKKRLSSPT
jgi:UV DNA damage endonuclease